MTMTGMMTSMMTSIIVQLFQLILFIITWAVIVLLFYYFRKDLSRYFQSPLSQVSENVKLFLSDSQNAIGTIMKGTRSNIGDVIGGFILVILCYGIVEYHDMMMQYLIGHGFHHSHNHYTIFEYWWDSMIDAFHHFWGWLVL